MSGRSSPASEGSTSASSEQVCALCGSASRTNTDAESSLDTGPESRVTQTCAPLWASPKATDADRGGRGDLIQQVRGNQNPHFGKGCRCRCHTSMSSAAAFPAKTSVSPARVPGSPEPARVFGPSSLGSLVSFDPDTCSWRTFQLSLIEDSDECLETWPRAGMTRSGIAYRLSPSVPLISVIGSGSSRMRVDTGEGLWPTPDASVAQDGEKPATWLERRERVKETADNSNGMGMPLTIAVQMWPTPDTGLSANGHGRRGVSSNPNHQSGRDLEAAARTRAWPTPTAQDASNNAGPSQYERNSLPLNAAVGGALNPEWVDWLMGYPTGWTALAPSETPSSRKSRNGSDAD